MRCFLIALSLLAFPTLGYAKDAPKFSKIAVLDVQVTGMDDSLVPLLTEVVTAEVQRLAEIEVISGQDIKNILGFEADKQAMNCSDTACLAELGGALGADAIFVAQVGKVGEAFLVTTKLVDARSGESGGRTYEKVSGSEDMVIDAFKKAVHKIFKGDGQASSDSSAASLSQSPKPQGNQRLAALSLRTKVLGSLAFVAGGTGIFMGVRVRNLLKDAQDEASLTAQSSIDKGETLKKQTNGVYALAGLLAVATIVNHLWLEGGPRPEKKVVFVPEAGPGYAGARWLWSF